MVLAVASAGWVFDVYEGQLFTIFKSAMFTELAGGDRSGIEWQGNLGFAVFYWVVRGRPHFRDALGSVWPRGR